MKSVKFLIVATFMAMSVFAAIAQPPGNQMSDEFVVKGKKIREVGDRHGSGTIVLVNEKKDFGFIEDERNGEKYLFIVSRAKFWYSKKSDKDLIKEDCYVSYWITKGKNAILITIL